MAPNTYNQPTPGESPDFLFQFDCDEFDVAKLNEFVASHVVAHLRKVDPNQTYSPEVLFNPANFFDFEIMLWLQPGYFQVLPITIYADKVATAKRSGKAVAPYQITAKCSFEFPIGIDNDYITSIRFNDTRQAFQSLSFAVYSIIGVAMQKFLNEVITE